MDNPTYREEVEDYLQEHGVFYNGMRGKDSHAHMDSYMTCVNFNKLEEAWEALKDKFSKDRWELMIVDWEAHAYCSRNCGIIAHMIKFYLNRPDGPTISEVHWKWKGKNKTILTTP